ncbi:MAG: Ldh family oxidoreductase, partial [Gemmatimonadota bacterium]
MADVLLSATAAARLCAAALTQVGVPAGEADCVADALVEASLRGADSHGLALLPTYVERTRSGQIRPGRTWVVRQETAAAALCDGQHGMGPVLACAAADLAAAKASRTGVAAVVLHDGNYVGALGYYVRRVAERGLLALAAANATPRVAPHGGRAGLHGTNPIAWAAPRAGGEPLVFDAATAFAAARVSRAQDEGEALPPGAALDAAG